MADPTCFQCGLQDVPVLGDDDWFHCERCGERIVSAAEFRAQTEKAEEDRIREALGVRNFKPTR
jgi:hypothetical protein